MKKLFTYLSVAMLGMAAASCQEEIGVAPSGECNVTITLQTPGVATKSIADGQNVDIVYYEIYQTETGHKNSLTGTAGPIVEGTVAMDDKEAVLNLNLLKGQTYVGLFWAQVNGTDYYVVDDLRNVQVNYPNSEDNLTLANDEARAAFCQKIQFVTGTNVRVELERPFAQINLGIDPDNLDLDYTVVLEGSSMTVTGVSNTFSVAEMTAGNQNVTVPFSLAAVPTERLSANGQSWIYGGMNYVLVPGDAATVEVSYTVKTDVGSVSRDVPAVPVQKNYRTNLLGDLLTQETVIEIVIDERFADYEDKYEGGKYYVVDGQVVAKVESVDDFEVAFDDAEVDRIEFVNNLTFEEGYMVARDLVFDLNGKEVKYSGNDVLFRVKNGATVTIDGTADGSAIETNPTEVGTGGNGYVGLVSENATLNITGGSYDVKETCTIVQVSNGVLNVYGGKYSVDLRRYTDANGNARYLFNCSDTPYKNGEAVVNVYGGSFYKFNPENNAAETAATNFCAVGYTVLAENDWYTVVPPTAVSNVAEINAALAAGENVAMAADMYDTALANKYGNQWYGFKLDGGVFDGNGHTLDFSRGDAQSNGKHNNYGILTSGGVIRNVKLSGVFRTIYIENPTEDVIIDNVIFDPEDEWGPCYPINTGEGDGTHSVIVKNSVIAGWNSYGDAVKDLTFTNCAFVQGSYYTDVYGRLSKPYVSAVYENCDFCSMYYIDLSQFVGESVVLRNCTVNGVQLTAANWTSLVEPEATCGEGQISIELRDGSYMTANNVADYVIFE